MRTINLTKLPSGKRYEDQYGAWLKVFKTVAESEERISVKDAPFSWVSLLFYLGADIDGSELHFKEDCYLGEMGLKGTISRAHGAGRLRELVEFHSALRPELVDALYKSDVEWKTKNRRHTTQKEFVVTCNGSFHRPEVLHYLNEVISLYNQEKPNCVLVPCAADKPYPAPLHDAVRSVIPDDYEIIIATGVLGLVPERLWDQMPLYDSGLPNEWRLAHEVDDFFTHRSYERVLVYSDFYNRAIDQGISNTHMRDQTIFVTPVQCTQYLPLRNKSWLKKLQAAANR